MAERFPGEQWSLDEAVDQFIAEGFRDGDLVSHDYLRHLLDINDAAVHRNEFVILERMEALKTVLLEGHKIALQNVRGRGYRIVPPAEQARFAAEEAARLMSKGLRKSNRLLEHTRLDALDTDERKRHTDTQVRLAALAGMVSKGKRDVFKLFDASKKKS
jgi:DNA-binding winged helix-turn-helix (wHTH) protein